MKSEKAKKRRKEHQKVLKRVLKRALKQTPEIWMHPEIRCGKPVIKGTRICVPFALQAIAHHVSLQDAQKAYPHVSEEQFKSAIIYAANIVTSISESEEEE